MVKSSFAVVTTAHGRKAESQSGRAERQSLIDEPKYIRISGMQVNKKCPSSKVHVVCSKPEATGRSASL